VATYFDTRDEQYQTEPDIGTSDIGLKTAEYIYMDMNMNINMNMNMNVKMNMIMNRIMNMTTNSWIWLHDVFKN
jgi:hypothetical protein